MTDLKRRTIGTTDLSVTALGFGGAPLGAVGDRLDSAASASVVNAAWDSGVRYFDTAPLYGHGLSERRLGEALRTRNRDEYVLSTKVGRLLVAEEESASDPLVNRHPGMNDREPFAVRYDYSGDAVKRSIEASLERLGVDRIDVLLCHDIDSWTHGAGQPAVFDAAVRGALPAMVELRDLGVVGAIGLGVNEWQVCQRVMERFPVDCFLLAGRFTLLEQDPLDEFLPNGVEHAVSIIVGGPYNSGLLANAERRRATYDYKPVDDARWAKTVQIREVCSQHGVDIRAAALQYPLRHPAVSAVIPGVWSTAEVEANVSLMNAAIPDELWSELAARGLARTV